MKSRDCFKWWRNRVGYLCATDGLFAINASMIQRMFTIDYDDDDDDGDACLG